MFFLKTEDNQLTRLKKQIVVYKNESEGGTLLIINLNYWFDEAMIVKEIQFCRPCNYPQVIKY